MSKNLDAPHSAEGSALRATRGPSTLPIPIARIIQDSMQATYRQSLLTITRVIKWREVGDCCLNLAAAGSIPLSHECGEFSEFV